MKNSTALGANSGKSTRTITFKNEVHKKFYMEYLPKCRYQDVYHKALVYCLGLNSDTRDHVDRIYDFKEGYVKPECLYEGWQTSGSMKVVRMAYNLYCNGTDKDNEEKKKMEDARALIKKRRAFIKENYKEWNFFNAFCLTTEYPERPICFFFEFRESSGGNIFDLINNKQKCICRDGLIKEVTVGNFEECAFVNNREEAVEILGNIAKIFEEYLNNDGLAAVDDYHQCFSISFRRHGIPSHLFEKSEIETAMRNADDRHNNQLVVDEDGYVKIISDNKDGMLYPVCLECWNAGNNYVGKFSKLCTLDEDYKYCLHGWLRYLKTGRKQYMDYLTEEIEEDSLISQIKEFYNK